MVFYTCCTLNHLAQAKVLGNSIKKNSRREGDVFLIFLADKINSRISAEYIFPFEIIEITEKNCFDLSHLIKRYNSFELVCYIKSHAALMLCDRFPDEKIVYLDTDIYVYNSFVLLDNLLDSKAFIITPHILEPVEIENKVPEEKSFLYSGIYNAGFFAFKANARAILILQWLNARLKEYCKVKASKGLVADQIWFNHIPVLFHEDTLVLRDKGYNMAYWNLGERSLFKHNDTYMISDEPSFNKLIFYHFSGYDFKNPRVLSKYQNKYSFETRPVLKELFNFYFEQLIENDHPGLLKNGSFYYSNGLGKLVNIFK
jgi:hypothetical protein